MFAGTGRPHQKAINNVKAARGNDNEIHKVEIFVCVCVCVCVCVMGSSVCVDLLLHYLIKRAQGGRAKTKAEHAKPKGGTAPRSDAFARALPPFSNQRPGSPTLRL